MAYEGNNHAARGQHSFELAERTLKMAAFLHENQLCRASNKHSCVSVCVFPLNLLSWQHAMENQEENDGRSRVKASGSHQAKPF